MIQNKRIFSVDEMTAVIKAAIMREPSLQNMSVQGELLGFKVHTSGHVYFSLKGQSARVNCVMFRSNARSVIKWPKDGDEVIVRGSIDLYPVSGAYQVYVTALLPVGVGAKARAKEELKARLAREGLFDVRLKRPLPKFPERVGVITSPTGAALQDIIKLHSLRFPCCELIVIPSLMQGIGAAEEISAAFSRANTLEGLSCVILARGGGSRDDLDVFDDESVVRAVRMCAVPVITGLGHQIDSTLCDMAADAYAPTPSGAAERLFPDRTVLLAALQNTQNTLYSKIVSRISGVKNRLDYAMAGHIKHEEMRLSAAAARMESVSPVKLLARGYSVCTNEKGLVVKSVNDAAGGEKLNIKVTDGIIKAVIL